MSPLSVAWGVSLALGVLGVALGLAGLRYRTRARGWQDRYFAAQQRADDKVATLMDLNATVVGTLSHPDSPRYEVRLSDWGPEFTGADGALPRWRWTVVDADRDLRIALGLKTEGDLGTTKTPYMLGNEHTALDAVLAAMQWMESNAHPLQFVYVGGHQ